MCTLDWVVLMMIMECLPDVAFKAASNATVYFLKPNYRNKKRKGKKLSWTLRL